MDLFLWKIALLRWHCRTEINSNVLRDMKIRSPLIVIHFLNWKGKHRILRIQEPIFQEVINFEGLNSHTQLRFFSTQLLCCEVRGKKKKQPQNPNPLHRRQMEILFDISWTQIKSSEFPLSHFSKVYLESDSLNIKTIFPPTHLTHHQTAREFLRPTRVCLHYLYKDYNVQL